MQERGDGPLLIEAVFGGKSEDIDATKVAVGSLTNQLLDGRDATSVGRLPQHTEESFAFAHCRELRLCDLDFIAHRSECLFAALPTRAATRMSELGSSAVIRRCPRHVRYNLNSGAKADITALRVCANFKRPPLFKELKQGLRKAPFRVMSQDAGCN